MISSADDRCKKLKKDIDLIAGHIEGIGELSLTHGCGGGVVNDEVIGIVYNKRPEMLPVANWLLHGGIRRFFCRTLIINI